MPKTLEERRAQKREYQKEWCKRNPNYSKEYIKRRYDTSEYGWRYRAYARKGRLKAKFGLTPERYDEMSKEQADKCALCEQPKTINKYRLAIDHCHDTGAVRFLLCVGCNVKLHAFENAEFRAKAEAYLQFHRDNPGGSYNDYVAIITNGKTCVNGKVYSG